MNRKFFVSLSAISLSISALFGATGIFSNKQNEEAVLAAPSRTYTVTSAESYYANISDSLTGDNLLSALRSLNSSNRKSTVGYSGMGTDPSGQFKYTDYDPDKVRYDSNGQPYGTSLITFYSGNSATTGMNREHVWPKSHGGNLVEGDIHMPRPTLEAENGSRGNSFYVEGKKDGVKGWDPAMESFGVENYRGDSARIIFYCCIANSNLSLIDAEQHETSNANRDNLMGKLTDLLKWNLKYPVLEREDNRNDGAQYLQGNRNPFIDHPEYACRIWGETNSATRAICSSTPVTVTLSKIEITKTGKTTYNVGDNFDPSQFTVTATYSDGSTKNVTSSVTWSPTAMTASTTKVTASYTEDGVTKTASVNVTVNTTPVAKTLVSISKSGSCKTEYSAGESFDPTGLTITASYSDGSSSNVTSSVSWNPTTITSNCTVVGTYTYQGISKTVNVPVTIKQEIQTTSKVVAIEVANEPDKTIYFEGEDLIISGLVVKAIHEDGTKTTLKITDLSFVKPPKTIGIHDVIIRYSSDGETFETSFKVNYVSPTVVLESLRLVSKPKKTTYYKGEELVKSGLKVNAIYADGTFEDVTSMCRLSGSTNVVGTSTVTVIYSNLQTSFEITVQEGEATVEESAVNFTYKFEDVLEDVKNVEDVTLNDWFILAASYETLDDEAKSLFQEATYEEDNQVSAADDLRRAAQTNIDKISQTVKNYDQIVIEREDEGFVDFMGRAPGKRGFDLLGILKKFGIWAGVIILVIIFIAIIAKAVKKSKERAKEN